MAVWSIDLAGIIKSVPARQRAWVIITLIVVGGALYGQHIRHESDKDAQRESLELLVRDVIKMRCE